MTAPFPFTQPDRFGTLLLAALGLSVVLHQVWTFMPFSGTLPVSAVANLIMMVPMLLGAWACWRAGGLQSAQQRGAVMLIGFALLMLFIGSSFRVLVVLEPNFSRWVGEVCFVMAPLLLIGAFLWLTRQALRMSVVLRLLLDVLILGVAVGTYAWKFVLAGFLEQTAVREPQSILPVLNLVLDAATFGLLCLIAIRWRGPGFNREASLYILAVLCLAVADVGFASRSLGGQMGLVAPTDAGWSWAALVLAVAVRLGHSDWSAFVSSTASGIWRPVPLPNMLRRPNRALSGLADVYGPIVAALLTFALAGLTLGTPGIAQTGVQIGAVVLALLVVLRQMLTLIDNQRLNLELTRLSADLEQRVFDRTRELEDREHQLERSRQLEQDRGRLLEMIARDEPLEKVHAYLADMTDQHKRGGLDEHLLHQVSEQLISVALGRRKLNEQLAHQASFDALTGLPNRALLGRQLEAALRHAEQRDFMVAVLFIDLNRFKQINDSLGHPVGDRLLQLVAKRFQACIGPSDTLARMGGDEFVVVRAGVKNAEEASQLGQKLVDALTPAFRVDELELFVSASVGISFFPHDGTDGATLQKHADVAMYRAKSQGAGSIRRFSKGMSAAAREKLEIENELRRALERVTEHPMDERGELFLHYQPQVDLRSDALLGFEALARWNHPTLGVISPLRFIPIAEESGLVVPLGNWVLREACRQNAVWQRAGLKPVRVAVNVSTLQFDRTEMIQNVVDALSESGLDARYLELELMESLLVQRLDESARRMEQLRNLGVSLAIDDFGTGYSSLRYLQRFPIDTLKIDRSFTQGIPSDTSAYRGVRSTLPLVQAITALADGLGLGVVAEGVETERHAEALERVGCNTVQGHLYARAVGASEAEQMLRAGKLKRLSLRERALMSGTVTWPHPQPAD